MKRLAIVLAAVIVFTTAWSVSSTQKQLDNEYKQLFAEKQQTKPTETIKADKIVIEKAPEKPSDVSKDKVEQIPDLSVQAQPARQNEPKKAVAVGGCENYRSLVAQYDWDVRIAMAVMQQESTMNGIPCNPNAINATDDHRSWAGCMGSFGLFQINCSHGQVYDPAQNVAIAYSMYKGRGWQPWSSYTSGEYAKYLK